MDDFLCPFPESWLGLARQRQQKANRNLNEQGSQGKRHMERVGYQEYTLSGYSYYCQDKQWAARLLGL